MVPSRKNWGAVWFQAYKNWGPYGSKHIGKKDKHGDIWFKILYKCRTYLRFKESKVLTNGSKLPSIKTKLTIKQKSISKFFLDFQEILGLHKTILVFLSVGQTQQLYHISKAQLNTFSYGHTINIKSNLHGIEVYIFPGIVRLLLS